MKPKDHNEQIAEMQTTKRISANLEAPTPQSSGTRSEHEHTSGTWKLATVVNGLKITGFRAIIPDNVMAPVAYVADQDNAEFIVRACNAHQDLLEACKTLVSLVEDLHG